MMVTAYGLSGVGDGEGDRVGVGDRTGVGDGVADKAGVHDKPGVGEIDGVIAGVGVGDEPAGEPVGVETGVCDGLGEAEASAVGAGVAVVAGGVSSAPSGDADGPSSIVIPSSTAAAGPEAQANSNNAANNPATQRFRIPLPSRHYSLATTASTGSVAPIHGFHQYGTISN